MMLMVFRGVWFLSVMAVLATLLYVYASLPEEVIVQQEGANQVSLSKETLFYAVLGVVTLINVLVYVIARMFKSEELFRSWFHGLIFTLNVFFMVALQILNVINSAEKFDFIKVGFLIYGSIGLILIWALAWPVYSFYRKIFSKLSV